MGCTNEPVLFGGSVMKHRLIHVINNLETGGAETMLLRLMQMIDRSRFDPVIITMIEPGSLGPSFDELGIEMHALGARPGRVSPRILLKLRRLMCSLRPDLIQSWLYHSNLAAFLARSLHDSRIPIAWNIRHSVDDIGNEPWLTRQVIRAGARFSRRVSGVVFNSETSFNQHLQLGFSAPKQLVIPNGFDLSVFRPIADARGLLVKKLGLESNAFLVGLAARYHPMKGHERLAAACARLASRGIDVQLLFAGRGCEPGSSLETLRESTGIGTRLHLLGEQRPLAPFLSALDALAISSNWGEAFPNVLAEAMACEVACVATDVGDASTILGDSGRIVQPGDTDALFQAVADLHALGPEQRAALGAAGRNRIQDRYDLKSISGRYDEFWTGLVSIPS